MGSWFVVRTADPAFRDVLPELAYSRSRDEFARPFAADASDLDRIYRNFERHISELLEQTARRQPVPWEEALGELAARLERTSVEWFLCGSAAMAVRRIAVAPRDIDFVTADHAAVAEALGDVLIEPVSRDSDRAWVAEWFGRAWLGARVEWVADIYPEIDQGGAVNEIGPAAASRLERVDWNGRTLLLTPLDLQLAVSAQRGLAGRVDAIRRFHHGA